MAGHKKVKAQKQRTRLRRKTTIRKRVVGTPERPRLSVFRSAKHIYVQAIDDSKNQVLAAASDLDAGVKGQVATAEKKKKKDTAKLVGVAIGKKLIEQKVTKVVFDRNGFVYHGRVKEVAAGAREAGLEF